MNAVYLGTILLGGVAALDATPVGQTLLSQPLVTATILGLWWGDLPTALEVGIVLQILAVSTQPVGARTPEDYATGGVVGAALALALVTRQPFLLIREASALVGVLAGLVVAMAGAALTRWLRRRNEGCGRWCEAELREGREEALGAAHRAGVVLAFALGVKLHGHLVSVWGCGDSRSRADGIAPAGEGLEPRASAVAGARSGADAQCLRAASAAARRPVRRGAGVRVDRPDRGGSLMSLSASVLRRMAVRASLLQATWNYERQQGLGWAWSLMPALDHVLPDRADRAARLAEHTAYFNTQPTLASVALGVVAGLEEQRAQGGAVDADQVARVKGVLGSALAALGDRLFWFTLRPFAACVGLLLAVRGSWVGALAMWLVYNLVHLGMRWRGVGWGYRSGPAVLAEACAQRSSASSIGSRRWARSSWACSQRCCWCQTASRARSRSRSC